MATICVIPDVQVKQGVSISHLEWAGKYIAEKKPNIIVQLGDFADMSSLSSYDVGKKSFEGRSYIKDINAVHTAMATLMAPIHNAMKRDKKWKPKFVLTLGNHEDRITRAINSDRKLEGLISIDDLKYKEFGWEVIPYLEVKVINGVAFSHYFVSGVMGRPITTANALLTKKHMSCIAGHQQGRQIAYARRADGKEMTAIIAGSFYQHDEDYLTAQGNTHYRGMYFLHEVNDGAFDEMALSINYLKERYGRSK